MKKYVVYLKESKLNMYDSREKAEMFIISYVTTFNKFDKNHFLSIYDFTVKEEDNTKIEDITDYEEAIEFLSKDLKYSGHYTNQTVFAENSYQLEALNKLMTIAKAWNKIDNFKPDFKDSDQLKYYPLFAWSVDTDKYVCTSYSNASVLTTFNSLICFKTKERSLQFGKQFEDLYNQAFGN